VKKEAHEFAFILMLFHYSGTAVKDMVPQLVVEVLCNLLATILNEYMGWDNIPLPTDVEDLHKITGSIVGFLLIFRTSLAYDRYYEGRKLIGQVLNATREMVSACYVFRPRDDLSKEDSEEFQRMRESMRRRSLLLWGVIRHSLRESKLGFNPLIDGEPSFFQKYVGRSRRSKFPFETEWHRDSCRPLVSSVMTEPERAQLEDLEIPKV
jgi:hypothetical protein